MLNRVTTSMSRFKISFILTSLVVAFAVMSMLIYLTIATDKYIENLIIQELSYRGVYSSRIAEDARDL